MVLQAGCIQVQTVWAAALVGPTLGPAALGAVVMGGMLGNLTLRSLIMGGMSAFDALGTNAFGAKDFAEVGVLAQRGALLCSACFPVMYVIWLFIEPLLKWMGQPSDVVPLVAIYLRGSMAGFPAVLLNATLTKFLVAQSCPIDGLLMVTVVTNLLIHPCLLIWGLPIVGFAGVAWISALIDWLRFSGGFLMVMLCKPHNPDTWPGLRVRKALQPQAVCAYCRLAIPGVWGMNEWWYWELLSMMIGALGTAELSAHAVGYSFGPFLGGGMPGSLGAALGARVGAMLAEKRCRDAKRLARFGAGAGALWQITTGIVVFLARDWIISRYTESSETSAFCREIWPLFCLGMFSGGFFNVQAALLRTLGMHTRLAAVTFVLLWCITIPSAYLLAFPLHLGLLGIYLAHAGFRLLFMNPLLLCTWCCMDWEKHSEKLRSLREKSKSDSHVSALPDYGRLDKDSEGLPIEGEKLDALSRKVQAQAYGRFENVEEDSLIVQMHDLNEVVENEVPSDYGYADKDFQDGMSPEENVKVGS